MLAFFDKLKLSLEIASVLIGLVLGVLAIWQHIKPSGDLVAEVVVTKARLPAKLLRDAKALPDNLEKALMKNPDFVKLLPHDMQRDEVLAVVKDSVERQSFSLHEFESLRDSFMAVAIRNDGERPLREVKLGFRYPLSQSVTVIGADGVAKDHDATGIIPLGDLPPHGEIQVYAWGMAFLIGNEHDVTISHQDGVGQIRLSRSVPPFIWGNEGIFFSYRHTTYGLLAIILLALGLVGLSRYRTSRSSKELKDAA